MNDDCVSFTINPILTMTKLDELKEKISFLSKLFFVIVGLVVLIISGLVSLYLSGNINEIFWIGIALLFILGGVNLIVFLHIHKYIKEVGKV